MSSVLELTQDLMSRASVSPTDGGCQALMIQRLQAIGFEVENLRFGPVDNFWATRGASGPVFCFAGHTDVVPSGPVEDWRSDPFTPAIDNGVLYGRGAADMKSGLAAMITATEQFVAHHPHHAGTIAFLITSDEEGPSVDGTRRVVEVLRERGQGIDWCLVGEPSSEVALGDTIKIGRRGSLSGRLTVHGIQGHIAYPQFASNPVHALAPALAELAAREWDRGNEHFQPTTFQVSNISAGTGAPNVIPGELKARFNLRFSTVQTVESLKATVEEILARHKVNYSLEWFVSGYPFLTVPGALSSAACQAVSEQLQITPKLSTGAEPPTADSLRPWERRSLSWG
jgi:succinyl-diaminopimelate desuccinylase